MRYVFVVEQKDDGGDNNLHKSTSTMALSAGEVPPFTVDSTLVQKLSLHFGKWPLLIIA